MAHNCIILGVKVQGLRFGIGFVKCWHSMYKRNAVALLQMASLMAHQGIGSIVLLCGKAEEIYDCRSGAHGYHGGQGWPLWRGRE